MLPEVFSFRNNLNNTNLPCSTYYSALLLTTPPLPFSSFIMLNIASCASQAPGQVPGAVPVLRSTAGSQTQVGQVLFLHQHHAVGCPSTLGAGKGVSSLVWAGTPPEAGWEPPQQDRVRGSPVPGQGPAVLTLSRLSLWCFLRWEKTSSTLPGEKLFKVWSVSTVFWADSAYIYSCCEKTWRWCMHPSGHR